MGNLVSRCVANVLWRANRSKVKLEEEDAFDLVNLFLFSFIKEMIFEHVKSDAYAMHKHKSKRNNEHVINAYAKRGT